MPSTATSDPSASLLDAFPTAVAALDGNGDVVFVNRHWQRSHAEDGGFAPRVGQSVIGSDAAPDGWPSQAVQRVAAVLHAPGAASTCEYSTRSGGERRWYCLQILPIETGGVLLIREEVTGSKRRAEEAAAADLVERDARVPGASADLKDMRRQLADANAALRLQGSELRTLFDLVPAMLWFKDISGRILQINERAAAFRGLSVEQATGLTIAELFPQQAARYSDEDRGIERTGRPLLGLRERMRDPAGREIWLQTDKVPCRDAKGRLVGIMVMKQDITESVQLQESLQQLNESLESRVRERTAELALARDQAEQASKAKSTFLATMSHEIRTPMAGLLGLLELLDLSSLGAEERATLRVAREAGGALKRIIDGVLDLSRIEANSLELDPQPASVGELVAGICRLHAPVAATRKIALECHVSDAVSPLHRFDALRLGQILNNFISNSIKFTPGGRVQLAVDVEGRSDGKEHLSFVVRDTGIGIPQDRVERLFQPFVQADAQTAVRYGGTGLGLFIARRLAELMGGSVLLTSAPGVGTTAVLSVAFEVCHEAAAPPLSGELSREQLNELVSSRPQAPSVQQAEADRTLLLVVDDHAVNRMVLMRQLSTLGYAAEPAVDGIQGLQAWESGRFAGIITDCNMPGMTGYELAREIRSREAARRMVPIPIIGCTANALGDAAAQCSAAGMDDTITKPASLQDICLALDRWLPLGDKPSGLPVSAAQPGRGASADGLLDLALITAVSGDDAMGVSRLLEEFQRSNDADVSSLRRAVQERDDMQTVQFAHRIRGACAMVGARHLAQASAEVQAAAASHDEELVQACMDTFERELVRFNTRIQPLLASPAPDRRRLGAWAAERRACAATRNVPG